MVKRISINCDVPLKWESVCGQYNVCLTSDRLEKIYKMALAHNPQEVGTSLIGNYSEDGYTANILDVAPLTSDSKGCRCSFCRGTEGLQEFYANLKRDFAGQRHYVGEWHSHPGMNPSPSLLDDKTQFAIAQDVTTNCPESILLILGGNFLEQPKIGIFVYSRKIGRIKLTPVGAADSDS